MLKPLTFGELEQRNIKNVRGVFMRDSLPKKLNKMSVEFLI